MISEKDLEAFGYYTMMDAYPKQETVDVQALVKDYNETADNKKDSSLYETLIDEEHLEFSDFVARNWYAVHSKPAGEEPDYAGELKELADLVYVLYGYAWCQGWDLNEAIRRVHENNMGRMYQLGGVIQRREDGKVVKNPDYPKVNLEDLV